MRPILSRPLSGAPGRATAQRSGESTSTGRFARLLALGGPGPGADPPRRAGASKGDSEPLGEREPRETSAEGDGAASKHKGPEPTDAAPQHADVAPRGLEVQARGEVEGNAPRGETAAAERQAAFGDMAQRMLRSVQVQQLPNGSTALNLRLESGRFSQVEVDLRFEAGKLRASLGVAEGNTYRALNGKLASLQGALDARGIAAHPVRLDLRKGSKETSTSPRSAKSGRDRRARRARGPGGGRVV